MITSTIAGPSYANARSRAGASCAAEVLDLGRSAPGGVAISELLLCALATPVGGAPGDDTVVACHIIGSGGGLVDILDGGPPVAADQLAVDGPLVVVTTVPDAGGVRWGYEAHPG